jgi:hypothetical protein
MKLATSQRNDVPTIDDIFVEDEFNHPPKASAQGEKKEQNIIKFLYKFAPDHIERIDQYVAAHRFLLNIPPPPKISVFEDALILSEFIKAREGIKEDRTKTMEHLCD